MFVNIHWLSPPANSCVLIGNNRLKIRFSFKYLVFLNTWYLTVLNTVAYILFKLQSTFREAKEQIMCFVPDIMEGTVPKYWSAPIIVFLYRLCFTPRKKTSKLFFSMQSGSTGLLSPCHAFVSFCIKRKNMYSYVWVCIWGQSSWRAGLPELSSLCIYQPFKCQSTGGRFFTTHLITENITAEGWVGSTLRHTSRGPCRYFLRVYAHSISNIEENTTDI